MFSSRLNWDTRPNPLAELLAQKTKEGTAVLDLTESNPTRAGFEYPTHEILNAASDRAVLTYEPDPRGMQSAREAVVQYYAAQRVNAKAKQILLTASTSEAYSYLFKLLTDPGAEVLVPRPSYPLFEYLAALESVKVVQYPLRYDGQWHVDFAALEQLTTQRTRAIVVVNPNNPTGSFLKADEWARLDAFAAEKNIAVLSDEVFSDYAFAPDDSRLATLIRGDAKALTFSMSGLSKVCGLPQMKLGWIVVSGPNQQAALNGLEWIADTFLSVATPVQVALPRLLSATVTVRAQILRRTRANLAFLQSTFAGSACQVLNVEGGWCATLQVPRTRSEEEWTLELLGQHNVRVQPGFFYEFESEAFLVLSLLTPPQVFEEGVGRMTSVLR